MAGRCLSNELQKKAIKELHEDTNKIDGYLSQVREWIGTQRHLKINPGNKLILSLLRNCKFDIDRLKDKINVLNTLKTTIPQFFSNRDPFSPDIQELLNLGLCLPLPKTKDATGARVILGRIVETDTAIILETLVKLNFMILEILLIEDDNYVIAGGEFFIDNKNLGLSHTLQATPSLMRTTCKCLFEIYSANPQGIHIFNIPWYAQVIYNLFSAMLPEHLKNLLHNYTEENMDELYRHIPLSVLPEEYGGTGGCLEDIKKEWKEKVESYRELFLEDERCYSNEREDSNDVQESTMFGVGWLYNKLTFQ